MHYAPGLVRTLYVNEKKLTFVKFLHHDSTGLASLYQDSLQNKFVLKSTLGKSAKKEARFNQRLNRLFHYKNGNHHWDNLLFSYIEGMNLAHFMAKHVDNPDTNERDGRQFNKDYLQRPYASFFSGLDRNITIAIQLVKAHEMLFNHHIVHRNLQLSHFIISENEQGVQVYGVDFSEALDIHQMMPERKLRIMKKNIENVVEVLKGVLPQEVHKKFNTLINIKSLSYQGIIEILQAQLSAPRKTKTFTPSFLAKSATASPLCIAEKPLPSTFRKHQEFIQTQLKTSIKTENLVSALCYLSHGAYLDETMVKILKKNDSLIAKVLNPHVEEFATTEMITFNTAQAALKHRNR